MKFRHRLVTLVLAPGLISSGAFAAPRVKPTGKNQKPAATSLPEGAPKNSANGPATMIPLETTTTTGLGAPNGYMNFQIGYLDHTTESDDHRSTTPGDAINGRFAFPSGNKFTLVVSPGYRRWHDSLKFAYTDFSIAGAYHVSPELQIGLGLQYRSLALSFLGKSNSVSANRPVVGLEYLIGSNQFAAEFGLTGSGTNEAGPYLLPQEIRLTARAGLSGPTYGILKLTSSKGEDLLGSPDEASETLLGLGMGKKDLNIEACLETINSSNSSMELP